MVQTSLAWVKIELQMMKFMMKKSSDLKKKPMQRHPKNGEFVLPFF
jgi:hypothetical protein